jgi:uncharacterized protein Veg
MEVYMDFEQKALYIETIRSTVIDLTEKRIKLRANMGRSRIVEREGVVKQAHPSHFILEAEEKRGRLTRHSYQYVDVLTGMVELTDVEKDIILFEGMVER